MTVCTCRRCKTRFEHAHWATKYCSEACRHAQGVISAEKKRIRGRKTDARPERKARGGTTYRRRRAEQIAESTNACEICSRPFVEEVGADFKLAPRWDHNHSTGQFRGWLCHQCNVTLGLMSDSPELLRKAAADLDERGHS